MKARKYWHVSITDDRLMQAAQESMSDGEYMGFCIACGEEAYGVEPDARGYDCEVCEKPQVYGAEELLMMSVC